MFLFFAGFWEQIHSCHYWTWGGRKGVFSSMKIFYTRQRHFILKDGAFV